MITDYDSLRRAATHRYLHDPVFHARVENAVRATEEAVTAGGRFTQNDRDIATGAAAAALVIADSPVVGL